MAKEEITVECDLYNMLSHAMYLCHVSFVTFTQCTSPLPLSCCHVASVCQLVVLVSVFQYALQSSSPSYLLMASLDGARAHAQQQGVWEEPLRAGRAISSALQELPGLDMLSQNHVGAGLPSSCCTTGACLRVLLLMLLLPPPLLLLLLMFVLLLVLLLVVLLLMVVLLLLLLPLLLLLLPLLLLLLLLLVFAVAAAAFDVAAY